MELKSPLILLFDRPCASVQMDLATAIADHPTFFVDSHSSMTQQNTLLLRNGVGLSLDWHGDHYDGGGLLRIFSDFDLGTVKSSLAMGLHEHVQDGLHIPEITSLFLDSAAELLRLSGAKAVVCVASGLLVEPEFFCESIEAYISGGVFPVLATIRLDYSIDGGRIESTGLSLFSGQEMSIEATGLGRRELMRRALRLAHDIATQGPITEDQLVDDIEGQGFAQLSVEAEGKLLRCLIQSGMD